MTITVDPERIAENMVANGFMYQEDNLGGIPEGIGWSDCMLDTLEELYALESWVKAVFRKQEGSQDV